MDLVAISKNTVGVAGERLSIDELIKKHPEGVTFSGFFTRMGMSNKPEPCFRLTTGEYIFATGGAVKLLAEAYLRECGSVTEVDLELMKKPLRFKISKVKTKGGKTWTSAEYIGAVDVETGELIG